MNLFRPLTIAFALGAPRAQMNPLSLYPSTTIDAFSIATRNEPRGYAGGTIEALQEFPVRFFRGLGENAAQGTCTITGMHATVQDENGATPESLHFLLRSADSLGRPSISARGLIFSRRVTLPTGSPGRIGWHVTVSFLTPVHVNSAATLFAGIRLAANPSWPMTDGLSVHAALYAGGPTGKGDNPRPNAPNHAWSVYLDIGALATTGRTMQIGINVPNPVLRIGNKDPLSTRTSDGISFGAGGLYPAIEMAPRDDGIELWVQDHSVWSGVTTFVFGPSWANPPIPIVGGNMNFMQRISSVGAGSLGNVPLVNGVTRFTAAAPGSVAPAYGTDLRFQAYVMSIATGVTTSSNTTAISF